MTNRSITGRTTTILAAVLAALALVLSACAADDDDGEVTMARANWDSGYMQAAIYAQLIEELGHQVSDPAENTRDPNGFYPALATGQFDLWVNGWFPLHDIYLEGQLVTGQTTDLPIEPVGFQVRSGALQGYMIDKATADAMGITSMSQLADASVARVFDSDGRSGQPDRVQRGMGLQRRHRLPHRGTQLGRQRRAGLRRLQRPGCRRARQGGGRRARAVLRLDAQLDL